MLACLLSPLCLQLHLIIAPFTDIFKDFQFHKLRSKFCQMHFPDK